jgi:hypothetical protein
VMMLNRPPRAVFADCGVGGAGSEETGPAGSRTLAKEVLEGRGTCKRR